jgi:hypothetical protein
MSQIASQVVRTKFPEVFRSTKLQSRQVSFSITPPPTPGPVASTYAATVTSNTIKSQTPAHPLSESSRSRQPGGFKVLRNSVGDRIDSILAPSLALVIAQKDKKLCNNYHILGNCLPPCRYEHGTRLNELQREARRFICRQSACERGLACDNADCLFGHHCPKSPCPSM